MAAAAQTSGANRSGQAPARQFFIGLFALTLSLVIAGVGVFFVLQAKSPLTLLNQSDRPIAAATVFIPARSPFSLSLLTRPERLIALQQAVASPVERQPFLDEVDQIKQTLKTTTGLDYDQDIQPWMGEEITFAVTVSDLDGDSQNGEQPGYLLAIEIAPERQQQAQEFLQLLWQRRSLAGQVPVSEQTSGVRILFAQGAANQSNLMAATALVGDQFVLFANDAQVLRQSIRSAQTAQNLAQNAAYRQSVSQLPEPRVGLAYFDVRALSRQSTDGLGDGMGDGMGDGTSSARHAYTAMGLGVTPAGLVATAREADALAEDSGGSEDVIASQSPTALTGESVLAYLPANLEIAVASRDLSQLRDAVMASGLPTKVVPEFFTMGQPSADELSESHLWDWVQGSAALGGVKSRRGERDWILAVEREPGGIARLDEAATAAGYSAVPVAIGEREATAWTRFKTGSQRGAKASGLQTELLGLHVQQDEHEIFASSVAAMNLALEASASESRSLLGTARFGGAIAPLPSLTDGYIYLDWPAIAPSLTRLYPALNLIEVAARPFFNHLDTVAATRSNRVTSVFVQLKGSAGRPPSRYSTAPTYGLPRTRR